MRLRLTVQRNRLPPVNVLWSVPVDKNRADYTITRLLEDINPIIPLEADEWGLEDYVVQVGGFECMHFSPVGQLLKDEDEVLIRTLSTAEIRARTLGGRLQINEGGQHLVDGIPFGRPLLRTPNRPHIRIPPRKRQRMLEDDHDAHASAESHDAAGTNLEDEEIQSRLMITANGEAMKDDIRLSNSHLRGDHSGVDTPNGTAGDKAVRFAQLPDLGEDSEDEEDDEDFVAEDDDDSDGDSTSTSGTSSDDSSSDASTSSGSGSSDDSDSESESDTSSSDTDSESDIDVESDASSGPEVIRFSSVPPGKGKTTTKSRNARRNLSKKLKMLKQNGQLDPNATLKDVRGLLQKEGKGAEFTQERAQLDGPSQPNAKKRKRQSKSSEGNGDVGAKEQDWEADLERRKNLLLQNLELLEQSGEVGEKTTGQPAAKRLRPDVSAIGRLLKQQTRPVKEKPKTKVPVTFEESPAAVDPEFYKSKLHISAFETYHEGYVLDAPPFPFQQHWDPACKIMYPLDRADKQRNSKKTRYQHSTYTAPHVAPTSATAEVYEDAPEGSPETPVADCPAEKAAAPLVLDYGDASNLDSDAGAAIESQIREDVATSAQAEFPPLPDDMSTIPALSRSDILPGAIIAFKFLMMNPNPEVSDFVTGIVERLADPIPIKLAMRDKIKLFPEEKQGEDEEDEEEQPDVLGGIDWDVNGQDVIMYMQFDFLHDPRLLKAAPT